MDYQKRIEKLFSVYFELLNRQQFKPELLDYSVAEKHFQLLDQIDIIETCAYSIFDLYKKDHIYYSKNHTALFGWDIDEAHQVGLDYTTMRIHPDDLPELAAAGNYFIELSLAMPMEEKKQYKLVQDYRFLNKNNQYVRIIEQRKLLELDSLGNIWLALCCMDISPDQDLQRMATTRAINVKTGDLFEFKYNKQLPNVESPLSKREKEILQLIAKGLASKQIADKLFISVNTVNTHRQRIIEKLNVSNTFEAVTYASGIGIC